VIADDPAGPALAVRRRTSPAGSNTGGPP